MKAFVFKPSNELIGAFHVEKIDELPNELQKFLANNPSVPINSYVEISVRAWIIESIAPLRLQKRPSSEPVRKRTVGLVLFSFNGRITRSEFWLKGVLITLPLTWLSLFILDYGRYPDWANWTALFIVAVSCWATPAIYVKRLHDRDKPGLMLLLLLIPFVNLWLIADAWFMKGTAGFNGFGEDPLEHKTEPQHAQLPAA